MTSILSRPRFQSILLNLPLLILFLCAWVSDRWPDLMLSALIVAFAVMGIEVGILVYLAKQKRNGNGDRIGPVKTPAETGAVVLEPQILHVHGQLWRPSTNKKRVAQLMLDRHVALLDYKATDLHAIHRAFESSEFLYRTQRARASEVTLWIIGDILSRSNEIQNKRASLHRRGGPGNWNVIPQGKDSFTIDAGAFEIEHFGGKTNIRIHDPSRVTVEGSERGAPVVGLPPDVKAAPYH